MFLEHLREEAFDAESLQPLKSACITYSICDPRDEAVTSSRISSAVTILHLGVCWHRDRFATRWALDTCAQMFVLGFKRLPTVVAVEFHGVILSEIVWLKLRTSALVKLGDEVRVLMGYFHDTESWKPIQHYFYYKIRT